MKAPKRPGREKPYSLRSQRSCREQWRLEADLKSCKDTIAYCEKRLSELEGYVERGVTDATTGRGDVWLTEKLHDVEIKKKELALYKKRQTAIRAEIDALMHPGPSKAAMRRKQQDLLFKLASERRKKDRLIASAVDNLRQLLQARRKAGAEMRAVARKIDLAVSSDGLDESRFDALLASLPADLLPASERWFDWFVGKEQRTKPYEVRHESFILPETLANCHAYRRGDRVMLV